MEKFVIALKTLLVIALLALPILLLAGIITATFLWYLACVSLSLGVILYALAIIVGRILEAECDECGLAVLALIYPVPFLILPAASTLLILWFFELAPEGVAKWIDQMSATPISAWIILALLFIGVIWSVVSLVTTSGKRH